MKISLSLLVLTIATLLNGCSVFNPAGSSEFSCPGMPKGVTCKSPREVYEMTNNSGSKAATKGKGKTFAPSYLFATEPNPNQELTPVPVLEQPKVMRIWIAPWVDKNDDQHWPGLVYTVLKQKQWHFGHEEFNGIEPPMPHKFVEPSKSDKQGIADKKDLTNTDLPKEDFTQKLN